MKKMSRGKRIFWTLAGVAFLAGAWFAVSAIVGNGLLFPTPGETFSALGRLALTGDFYLAIAGSLLSVVAGFLAGNVIGLGIGIASGLSERVYAFSKPGMALIKATPVASFIILVLLWMGRGLTPALTAFLIVLPVVWQNVVAGIRSADKRLLEMAKVFNLSGIKKFRYIYIPAATEGYIAAVRTSMGFAWKAGVAAEVLSQTARSLGGKIYNAKNSIETPELFAYTIVVVLVSILVEVAATALMRGFSKRKKRAEKLREGGVTND